MSVVFGAAGSVDGAGSGVTSLTTANFTMASGAVCWAILNFDSATTPSSLAVNWNTNEALSAISGAQLNDATIVETVLAYGLKNPTATTATCKATWTGALTASLGFASATGADTTTPFRNGTVSATGQSGTTASITISSATGNMTVGAFACGSGITAVSDHQEWRAAPGGQFSYAANDKAGSASNTQTATQPADAWDAIGFDIVAAAGAAVGIPQGFLFTPTRGPTRGLRPTQAYPPGPPPYGIPVGFLFTPPRGPTRGLRPTQAYPAVVVSTAALSGLSAIMMKGRAGPSGIVPLAGRSAIDIMARAAETGTVPLAGRSAIEVMARAAASGTVPLAGRSAIDVMARAAAVGTVPLAGRSAVEIMARGVVLPAIFLSGRTSLQIKGLAAVPSLPAALSGRSAIDIMARAAAIGTVPLSGLSAVEVMARGVVIPAVFLAGRSQLQVKGAASPAFNAALAGRSAIDIMARAGASGAVLLSGRSSEIATALATLTTSQPGTIPARGFISMQGRGILFLTQPPVPPVTQYPTPFGAFVNFGKMG